jgi:hypothetical protein
MSIGSIFTGLTTVKYTLVITARFSQGYTIQANAVDNTYPFLTSSAAELF